AMPHVPGSADQSSPALCFLAKHPGKRADPQGAAHGCAAFFHTTWMSCRKIPAKTTSRMCLGHKAFSLVRFFDAHQRNELGREARETPLICCPLSRHDAVRRARGQGQDHTAPQRGAPVKK